MSKLSLEALKEKAEAVASEELLESISGGTMSNCHTLAQDMADFVNFWFY
ncbi:hypothetical protein [Flavobacterium sp. KBS0721]|nr:hypothetical protein [Flavobacterium sp. KBS0721]